MAKILLTLRAIQELRDLRSSMDNHVIPEILQRLSVGDKHGAIPVRGATHVERIKRALSSGAYLRLFLDHSLWPGISLVIGAGLRQDGSIHDAYNRNFNALPREPYYQWHGETGYDWDFFINEGYLYNAELSEEQEAASEAAEPQNRQAQGHHVGFHSLITQSPPGTGKTITAAQRACLLWEQGYDVVFLLPEALLQQVLKYRCIRQIVEQNPPRFFVGTYYQWLQQRLPDFKRVMMTPQQELACFHSLVKRRFNELNNSDVPLTYRDVLLYQIYVLNDNARNERDNIYNDNQERIKLLSRIRPHWWDDAPEKCGDWRLEYAQALNEYLEENSPLANPEAVGTVIIVDEAQDYLLEEIEAIKALCRYWQNDYYPNTTLWLLGDLNQRISPVNFDWGTLHLSQLQEVNWPNYRTTQRILSVANRLKQKADQACVGKWLPYATSPEQCFEKPGDLVKVLVYPDLASAETFLAPLKDKIVAQMSSWERQHSLQWRLAARARLFCSDDYHAKSTDLMQYLEFMPVSKAKGREFESCIAFCIFDLPKRGGQLEAYTKFYTQLTRARRRLLIVTTHQQLGNMGGDIFQALDQESSESIACIEWVDPTHTEKVSQSLNWITEYVNELHFSETESAGLLNIVLSDACQPNPILYWDMYNILGRYGVSSEDVMELECELADYFFTHPDQASNLKADLKEPEIQSNPRLQALIYRCLGHSWQAALMAKSLSDTNTEEYADVLQGIAEDLRRRRLTFEAERLLETHLSPSSSFSSRDLPSGREKLLPLLLTQVRSRLRLNS